MMKRALFLVMFMVSVLGGLATAVAGDDTQRAVGRGGRLFEPPDVASLLERPYFDYVPMACTGTCLWVSHPGGWAFPPETVHYYLLTRGGIGFNLRIDSPSGPIEPGEGVCRPSNVQLSGTSGGVTVNGAKWITRDNVLVVRLTATNTSMEEVKLTLSMDLPSTNFTTEKDVSSWSAAQNNLNVICRLYAPGFAPAVTDKGTEPAAIYQVEGEATVTQRGSIGDDAKAAASGGRVLGSNFGARAEDYAVWTIDVKAPVEKAVFSVRYARANAGDAEYKLVFGDGRHQEHYAFKPTGGWGDRESDFGVATFPLGSIPSGPQRIRIIAAADGANLNVDALYIHAEGEALPSIRSGTTTLQREITLAANGGKETIECYLAAATKPRDAEAALKRVRAEHDPLTQQIAEYDAWLVDNVPAFTSDEALTRQYWHRATSILRKNLFHVGEGRLSHWGISEGRWTADWYANMISYGAGHQIREARWLRDPQYVRGIIATWCENEKENGVFPNFIRPNEIGKGQYTDWITSTVWDAHCVQPDPDDLKQWANALKKNVDGWLATYDQDNNGLLLVDSHWWTGMEWQPSFFFFKDFDKDKQDQQLERVDLTAYVYGDAKNLAKILTAIGDSAGAEKYNAIATKIRDAVTHTMWDDTSKYFYSVDPASHAKAMVKEVVGVYPFYFGMFSGDADSAFTAAWRSILNPDELWTAWPVASASKQNPAYSQDVMFHGKKVGGCMWNGPTWPHANSLVLSAMAETLRDFKELPVTTNDFYNLFHSFTMAQFHDGDIRFPWTGEYYNGDTAEWRTEQRDYNHSTYIDIVIADLVGLRPRPDEVIELHPLIAPAMPAFLLDGVRYHNHDITVAWNPSTSGAPSPDGLTGFRVYVDGKLRHHNPTAANSVILK